MIRRMSPLALAALLAAPISTLAQSVGTETTPPDAQTAPTTDRSMDSDAHKRMDSEEHKKMMDADAQKKKSRRKKSRRRKTQEQLRIERETGSDVQPSGGSMPSNAPAGGSNQGGEGTPQRQGTTPGTGY